MSINMEFIRNLQQFCTNKLQSILKGQSGNILVYGQRVIFGTSLPLLYQSVLDLLQTLINLHPNLDEEITHSEKIELLNHLIYSHFEINHEIREKPFSDFILQLFIEPRHEKSDVDSNADMLNRIKKTFDNLMQDNEALVKILCKERLFSPENMTVALNLYAQTEFALLQFKIAELLRADNLARDTEALDKILSNAFSPENMAVELNLSAQLYFWRMLLLLKTAGLLTTENRNLIINHPKAVQIYKVLGCLSYLAELDNDEFDHRLDDIVKLSQIQLNRVVNCPSPETLANVFMFLAYRPDIHFDPIIEYAHIFGTEAVENALYNIPDFVIESLDKRTELKYLLEELLDICRTHTHDEEIIRKILEAIQIKVAEEMLRIKPKDVQVEVQFARKNLDRKCKRKAELPAENLQQQGLFKREKKKKEESRKNPPSLNFVGL